MCDVDDMDETLTLPGTIPGLLRRGSPVWHPRLGAKTPCVVVACHTNDRTARVGYPWPIDGEDGDTWALDALDLDLTEATGRAHAAWWLDTACDRAGTWCGALGWRFRQYSEVEWRFGPWSSLPDGYTCRALADLDPSDPRLLPDGSRWVDAEALRLVVLHVAGVTP